MNYFRRLIAFVFGALLVVLGQPAWGQHPVVASRFTVADGLSDNSALCALRDSYGLLWVGTENGLNYYDGLRVRAYRDMVTSQSPTETNTVISLFEQDGDIWFGGTAGLYIFDREANAYHRFDRRTRYGVLVSSSIPKILGTDNHLIWLPTQGQGLFVYDTETGALTQDSRHGSFFSDAVVGDDGLLYAVTLNGTLAVFRADGQFVRQWTISEYTSDKNPISIVAAQGTLWLGYNTTLLRLRDDRIERQADFPQLGSIHSLLSDRRGRLFIGSDNGVFRYDPTGGGELVALTEQGSARTALTDKMVNQMMWDADSALVVMTHQGGVCTLSLQERGVRYLPLHNARSLSAIPPSMAALLPSEITTVTEDGRQLWIGTRHHGVRVLDTVTGQLTSYTYSADKPYTIPSNEVNTIYRTSGGEIYVLTSWGLNRFDRATGHFYGYSSISAMTSFVCMQEVRNGWIWASSTNRGLFCKRVADGTFDMFTSKTIGRRTVVLMHEDRQGVLWFCTNGGGLWRYNGETDDFERFDAENTILRDQAISFIEEDELGALWLGTPIGIVRLSPSRDLRDLTVYDAVESNADGVRIVERGGLRVYVNDITFPFAADNEAERSRLGVDMALYTRDYIALPYADNSFTLHFASERYSNQPSPRYEYMLQGFDKNWARGTSTAEATYAGVPPGDYVFLLRLVGQPDETMQARLRITILPPWYRSNLAYLIYILSLAALVVFVYYRTRRSLKRRYQQQMTQFQSEQEKATFQSKIRFFIDLVHEIRTPLTLMSLPLEQMEESELSEADRVHAKSIRRNMNYLLGITNQLLDFQKQENGQITLLRRPTDVARLLREISSQFDDAVSVQGKRLQLQLPEQPVVASMDADKMTKVMMNLVGNAMKYARHEIVVRLEERESSVLISVIDDGPGVPAEERDKIFDRYYQIGNDSVAASVGTGLGLAYAKMLAQAHDGDLQYTDAPGGGSCFTLTFQSGDVGELPAADEPAPAAIAVEAPASAAVRSNYRVLLVEDNEELLQTTSRSLGAWYKVLKARDGVEALDVLKHQEIDVIVSDVMMPRMDGIELCRRLKQNIETSHLPVILLTAKTNVESKVEGMESGADVYLEKPFSMRQLHLQLDNLLLLRQRFYERMRSIEGQLTPLAESDEPTGLNEQDLQFMERLQKSVAENLRDEQFSIDSLAEQLNMSRSSFYRKMKSLTGMSPTDYLKTARMNQAATLLREGLRSSEVCERVGFTSSSYFAKCFRAQFGCLPKEYVAN